MERKFRDLRADEIDVRVGRKIHSPKFDGVMLLLYKDARCDQDILDETVGPMNWQKSYSRDNANCAVSIWDDEKKQWISKEDTGTESNTEAEKGLASDSFKRACVCWGIGRKLYTRLNLICGCEFDSKDQPKGSWRVDDIQYDERKITGIRILWYDRYDEKVVIDTISGAKPKQTKPKKELGSTEKQVPGEQMLEQIAKDNVPAKATPLQIAEMNSLKVNIENVCKRFGVEHIEDITEEQADFVIRSKKNALKENKQ